MLEKSSLTPQCRKTSLSAWYPVGYRVLSGVVLVPHFVSEHKRTTIEINLKTN